MSMFLKANHNAVIASWKEDEKMRMRPLCGKLPCCSVWYVAYVYESWLVDVYLSERRRLHTTDLSSCLVETI